MLGRGSYTGIDSMAEVAKLEVVPLVFGLLPREAVARGRHDTLVKPLIREFIASLAVLQTPMLLDVLKAISDQLWVAGQERHRVRKWGIADVKAAGLYHVLAERQRGRCALCGRLLEDSDAVHLDHILPWFLVGDPKDGSNWQALCGSCNRGKSAMVSSLQFVESLNWFSVSPFDLAVSTSGRTRYVLLSLRGVCEAAECGSGPLDAHLEPVQVRNGLYVMDHAQLRCEVHR